jgi:OHCU decarboxylase
MRLGELNALDTEVAERELLRCCGSTQWARAMAASRPFDSAETMAQTSDTIWSSLERVDWLEAFAAHPRIGANAEAPAATPSGLPRGVSDSSRRGRGPGASAEKVDESPRTEWATQEQSGVASAPDDVRARLAASNRDYEARFGYIFIVCATGKSAGEMLALLDGRLTNDPDKELHVAAEEQRKITRLRLAKLLDAPQAAKGS